MANIFNRNKLKLKPLSRRIHNLDISAILELRRKSTKNRILMNVANKIMEARRRNAPVILMIGAHVLRSGVQKFIIDMMKNGFISCIATNGAGMIHDYEFSLIGATTESVAMYIKHGQFGLWKETGRLNDIINRSYKKDPECGMGFAVGKYIEHSKNPYKNISIFALAYRYSIPITVHVGIGYDIIHEHPNCSGAATGALSYNDFLIFANQIKNLENGVLMNFGSAIMAPEVYLKALSMARNSENQKNKSIKHFTVLVCDLHTLPKSFSKEPSKKSPSYYFRPWKTMLVRTVSDGGKSFYIKGRHSDTIPALWNALKKAE